MSTPQRRELTEPPTLHDRAIQDLSFIRRTMEGASSFTDVPGWGLVAIGLTAIGASLLAPRASSNPGEWLNVWLAEACLAALIGGVTMWRKLRKRVHVSGAPVLSVPARKFLFGFWPGMVAGAVLTFAFIDTNTLWTQYGELPRMLPGIWLLMYGVSVTTAGAFSVRAVPLMGAGLMALGVFDLLFVPKVGLDLMLGLGFGVWQIAFGFWIARRHGG
jgi:hypothetical protein